MEVCWAERLCQRLRSSEQPVSVLFRLKGDARWLDSCTVIDVCRDSSNSISTLFCPHAHELRRIQEELSRRRKSKSFSHTQRKHQNIISRKPLRDDDNMSLIAKNYRVNGAHKCGTSADEKLSGLVRSIRGGKADSCGPKTSHSSSNERHKFLSILKSDTASEGENHRSIDFIHESNA